MNKKHIEQEEYNLSPNEFHMQKDDYDLDMKEFNMVSENFSQQEFGSQPQSEFNEYQEEVKSKKKKSKFKKMMQYLVAGVAGAAIITSTAGSFISEEVPIVENDYYHLEYDTYKYKILKNKNYIITFDETKIDDYYKYLTEYTYMVIQLYAEHLESNKGYERVFKGYHTVPGLYSYTNANHYNLQGDANFLCIDGIVFGSELNSDDYYYSAWCTVGFKDYASNGTYQEHCFRYLEDLVYKFDGMSKKEIYNSIIDEYSDLEMYFEFDSAQWSHRYNGDSYNINFYYIENDRRDVEITIPTFLKIEEMH